MGSNTNYFYANQFKKSGIIGDSRLILNPNPFENDVKYNPLDTVTNTLVPGEGLVLVDNGASDGSGLPVVGKRAHEYSAIYGVVKFSTLKNSHAVGENFVIAKKGDIINFQASGAIKRGDKVSLVLATPGQVSTIAGAGRAVLGEAIDQAADGGIVGIELTCDNTAVSQT
jgi:hypothetical protein